MSKRIAALAAFLVALFLAVGWWIASTRVNAVRAQYDTTEALARDLVAHATDAKTLELTLEHPWLHVAVEDRPNGVVYEWADGKPIPRDLPPPPPGAPPPGQGSPGGGDFNPRPPRSPIANFAGMVSGRQAIRIPGDHLAVILAPNVDLLGAFLIIDLSVTVGILLLTTAAALWTVAGLNRSERKRLEATLEERRAAAKEFQRFLGDAGHELRTPLTIVSGYVDILSKDLAQSPQGARILEGLQAETSRMRALVEKMLLLARLESPVSVPALVDVGNVAKEVVAQMQARFPERSVKIITSNRASIVIDQDDLYEALRNLVENALRYAPASPVEIAITPDSSNSSIAVVDHGAGIPTSEHDKIFDRFYRGSSSESDSEGSGLGLAIVARVAARWNGIIALTSVPGNTMFKLQFPLADEVTA